MNSFILNQKELRTFTGLVRPGPQKKLLLRRGVNFTTDAVGHPVVTRSAVEQAGATLRGKGILGQR